MEADNLVKEASMDNKDDVMFLLSYFLVCFHLYHQ